MARWRGVVGLSVGVGLAGAMSGGCSGVLGIGDWVGLIDDAKDAGSNATQASSSSSSSPSSGSSSGLMGPYTTNENQILDKDSNPHLFRGLDRPSLESSCTGNISPNVEYTVMQSWGANVVRLPLNQDCWLNDPSNPSYTAGYESTVDLQVTSAQRAGLDIILDLHWSDRGAYSVGQGCLNSSNSNCQQAMADAHSTLFWQQVATKYKNQPNVIFELYNEPHVGDYAPTTTDWATWLNGGPSDSTSGSFTAVGMQSLYNAVRATGANNLVIVGGQNWAYDLSQVTSYAVNGSNIIYNTHPYASKTPATPASWETTFGFLTQTYPVISTAFGDSSSGQSCSGTPTDCNSSFDTQLIAFMDQKSTTNPQGKMSWTAWAFYPDVSCPSECTFLSLLYDTQFDPNAVGTLVMNALTAGP